MCLLMIAAGTSLQFDGSHRSGSMEAKHSVNNRSNNILHGSWKSGHNFTS